MTADRWSAKSTDDCIKGSPGLSPAFCLLLSLAKQLWHFRRWSGAQAPACPRPGHVCSALRICHVSSTLSLNTTALGLSVLWLKLAVVSRQSRLPMARKVAFSYPAVAFSYPAIHDPGELSRIQTAWKETVQNQESKFLLLDQWEHRGTLGSAGVPSLLEDTAVSTVNVLVNDLHRNQAGVLAWSKVALQTATLKVALVAGGTGSAISLGSAIKPAEIASKRPSRQSAASPAASAAAASAAAAPAAAASAVDASAAASAPAAQAPEVAAAASPAAVWMDAPPPARAKKAPPPQPSPVAAAAKIKAPPPLPPAVVFKAFPTPPPMHPDVAAGLAAPPPNITAAPKTRPNVTAVPKMPPAPRPNITAPPEAPRNPTPQPLDLGATQPWIFGPRPNIDETRLGTPLGIPPAPPEEEEHSPPARGWLRAPNGRWQPPPPPEDGDETWGGTRQPPPPPKTTPAQSPVAGSTPSWTGNPWWQSDQPQGANSWSSFPPDATEAWWHSDGGRQSSQPHAANNATWIRFADTDDEVNPMAEEAEDDPTEASASLDSC